MKTTGKTPLTVMAIAKDCSIDASGHLVRSGIKLRAVSTAERQALRIPSYKYLLP